MKRFAFKMQLKAGCEKEYEKRHAAIWPELVQMIKDQGVSNYSIFWAAIPTCFSVIRSVQERVTRKTPPT